MKLFLLIFFSLSAPAQATEYCAPLEQVFQSVAYCWQNEYYEGASATCLDKLDRDVRSTQAALAKNFQGNDQKSIAAQNSKLTNQEANLSQTDAGLKGLLARARQARAELELYRRNMIYPGRPSKGFVDALNLDAHLATFSCFREPWEKVGIRIAELDRKIAELERADGKTAALYKDTSGDNLLLQQHRGLPAGAARTTSAAGAAAKSGASPRKQSTITGEIHKKKP